MTGSNPIQGIFCKSVNKTFAEAAQSLKASPLSSLKGIIANYAALALMVFIYRSHQRNACQKPQVSENVLSVYTKIYSQGHRFRDRTLFWDSGYLCHFSTEMAEIWSPGTFSKGVWTHKISALYLLYFQSYETFSGNH